ncbi:MAG: SRPBCC family protein [Bacteroidota bacterium]
MTKIESDIVETNKSAEKLYNFLTDFNNFKSLLPEDKVSDFQSTNDTCSFVVKSMPTIGMKIVDKTPHTQINIVSHQGKVPFDFTLLVKLTAIDDSNSKIQMIFEADLNMMIRMMVEKPLTNFFNMLVHKVKELPV